MSEIKFLNTHIDNISMSEAINRIDKLIRERGCSYVVTPNLDHIVMLETDVEFAEVYENADLVVADGMSLIWLSKYLGTPIREKISGADLFPKMCEMAAKRGYSVFILGAAEGVADRAAANLQKKNPNLKNAGTYSPSFGLRRMLKN